MVGSHIHIDGGEISRLIDGKDDANTARGNNQTLSIDLNSSWTNTTLQIQTIDKGGAPIFNSCGLWPDGNEPKHWLRPWRPLVFPDRPKLRRCHKRASSKYGILQLG